MRLIGKGPALEMDLGARPGVASPPPIELQGNQAKRIKSQLKKGQHIINRQKIEGTTEEKGRRVNDLRPYVPSVSVQRNKSSWCCITAYINSP
jgi:hypothetical protein